MVTSNPLHVLSDNKKNYAEGRVRWICNDWIVLVRKYNQLTLTFGLEVRFHYYCNHYAV